MDREQAMRWYRSLYRIRRVEEVIVTIHPTDKIQSPTHLSMGQEVVSVGVCEALRPDDVVFGTYRSHACYLAKDGDLKRMMAELRRTAEGGYEVVDSEQTLERVRGVLQDDAQRTNLAGCVAGRSAGTPHHQGAGALFTAP